MALSFGVTVLPDPPYQRLIELIQLAEQHGFEYGWTYDSHVLWQESTPTLALAAAATERIKLGHMVTNPGTREPTVRGEHVRDAAGHLGRPDGDGDRARRLGAPLHQPEAREGRPVRGGAADDQAVHERRARSTGTTPSSSSPGCARSSRRSRCTWPATARGCWPSPGALGDGVIIQLADPDIIQWTMDTARKAAEEAGRDPAALKCIVCAPSHISDDIAAAREQVRWFPAMVSNHVSDLIAPLRRRRLGRAEGADRLRARHRPTTTTTSTRAWAPSTGRS